MKKVLASIIIFFFLFSFFAKSSFAMYSPTSVANNKYGIHILFPEEVSEAANLVNSSGGDWGYITVPIQDSDRDLIKWQKFMDECKSHHLIPIIRIATEGDYFVNGSWKIPSNLYIIDFANFLNSLDWPTKNRYVIIFNEPNRGDEWGGTPDPTAYANILNSAVDEFKRRSDKFFIIAAGLDNASADIAGQSINQFNFIRQENAAVPGIFGKIDGIATHSYPNPAFSSTPAYSGTNGISSFNYEEDLAKSLGGKDLPIFITETGWSTNSISDSTQIDYYKEAFANAWNNPNIVAVTPFILHADQGPFRQFSFIVDNKRTDLYNAYMGFSKTKGNPQIDPTNLQTAAKSAVLKTKYFTDEFTKNISNKVTKQTKVFFKWILGI